MSFASAFLIVPEIRPVGANALALRDGREWGGGDQQDSGEERR